MTGNIMLEYDQVATAGDPIIPRDAVFHGDRFETFKELARVAKLHGNLVVGQLNHPGRQVDRRVQAYPISASDLHPERTPLGFEAAKPHAASNEDLAGVVEGFAHAAEYLEKAGFDGVNYMLPMGTCSPSSFQLVSIPEQINMVVTLRIGHA